MIYSRAVDFCKYLIPQTPNEIGAVSVATLTTLFYSTRIGLALGVGYIGLKSWTWTFSDHKPSRNGNERLTPAVVPMVRMLQPTPEVLAKEQILMPNGELFGLYLHSSVERDTRTIPRPFRFFDILTSCYKPLGYWGQGNAFTKSGWTLPSEGTLQWVIDENDNIAGNCRLKQNADEIRRNWRSKFFYNENYLKKLLELNFHVFFHCQSANDCDYEMQTLFRENIFDESGHVKNEGIDFFIRHHWDVNPTHKPLLALVHAAFGDKSICDNSFDGENNKFLQLIKIPDEQGLRDVIALHEQFPDHEWRTIQALLRTYNDVDIVRGQLQTLAPENIYYVREDDQIVPADDSCNIIPVCIRSAELNSRPHNYLILGEGTSEDPYRLEQFQID